MRNRLLFSALLVLVLTNCQRSLIKPEDSALSWHDIVIYAQEHLPLRGTLVQKANGYVYLKVDDRFIHDLFPKLKASASFKKPPYFRRDDAPGAHISVFYENEHVTPQELGGEFKFRLKEIIEVHPKKNLSYIVLRLDAPELEKLREKYGRSAKINNNEFHITLAKKEG